MNAFVIEQGACGSGPARYENGLITLPDGTEHGIEAVVRIEGETGTEGPSLQRTTSALAGSLRQTLGDRSDATALPFPLRLAVSTMRAGLGAIEEGLRSGGDVRVAVTVADGTAFTASMTPDLVDLIRRDAELVRSAIRRAASAPGSDAPPAPAAEDEPPIDPGAETPLTSIFRYEKRNGRLRRVPVNDTES